MRSFVTVPRVLCAALLVVAAVWSNLPVRYRVARKRVADGVSVARQRIEIPQAQLPEAVVATTIVSSFQLRATDGAVVTDVDQSLEELIASGHYADVWEDITSGKFHDVVVVSGNESDVELVHYDQKMSTDAVLKDLDVRGYRPATLRELAVFLATNPDEPRWYFITALGSECPSEFCGKPVSVAATASRSWDDGTRGLVNTELIEVSCWS